MSQEKETIIIINDTIIIIHKEIICLSGERPAENTTPVVRRARIMLEKSIKDK